MRPRQGSHPLTGVSVKLGAHMSSMPMAHSVAPAAVVAVAGQPDYLHYVASKGAVLSMTRGLAKEVGKYGARVNVIAPGFVMTDATRNRPMEWQQFFLKARALRREQRPDDLVGTALYPLSDLAGFVSRQTLVPQLMNSRTK